VIPAAAHTPVLVYFDTDRVTTPAEICQACSDPDAGRWVPASFCPEAKAKMDQAPRQTGKAPQ
jgi:hypothetical protein